MNNSDTNIENIIHLMQTDSSIDAPPDAIKWSKDIFKSRAASVELGILQRIVAVLNQDLFPGAALGERSGSTGTSRQMLFEAGDNNVDLRIAERDGRFDIRGQILGDGSEGMVIRIGESETVSDEFGGFRFSGIAAGDYELMLRGDNHEIVLKGIVLD